MSTVVRNLRPEDSAACAALLAHAQAGAIREEETGGARTARLADPGACVELLDRLFSSRRSDAVVAEEGGRIVGYLAGDRQMFSPEDFASIYAEPRSVVIPLHGHVVADHSDAVDLYTKMYGALAGRWIDGGMFAHSISVAAEDADAVEAWSWLGFGYKSVCAIRDTAIPVTLREDVRVRVEQVGSERDDLIERFHCRLMIYQTGSPMFWPYNGEADAAVRDVRSKLLDTGQAGCFLAWVDDEPAGMMLAAPGIFLSPMLASSDTAYLWEGFIDPVARAGGVGAALLGRLMGWLASRRQNRCALHFVAGNPLGRRFWLGQGFRPAEVLLRRHVDERVAWARGPVVMDGR
ncbi:MAG: GNAT superfamily N-acetyltransferase [Hyphomicrobiaceae bacterium]|jgi:GNAT superfamily N-acetyltransferase